MFTANETKDLLKHYGIVHIRGRPYHPQSQGLVERLNGTLKKALQLMIRKKYENKGEKLNFEELTDIVASATELYNETMHGATGVEPKDLFGDDVSLSKEEEAILYQTRGTAGEYLPYRFPGEFVDFKVNNLDAIDIERRPVSNTRVLIKWYISLKYYAASKLSSSQQSRIKLKRNKDATIIGEEASAFIVSCEDKEHSIQKNLNGLIYLDKYFY